MNTLVKGTLAVLGAAAFAAPALAQFGGPPAPPNTGVPLFAKMTGHAERPNPGDATGGGQFTVVVDPPKGTACYMFFGVKGIGNFTAAHIHSGGPDAAGPPVVVLETPQGGTGGGCAQVTADVANALIANPGGYYVNVHSAAFPQGAVRGQLAR